MTNDFEWESSTERGRDLSVPSRKIAIITPVFGYGGTGASVYYRILSDHLVRSGHRLFIITERGQALPGFTVYSPFPARSALGRRWLRDHAAYFVQNLAYCMVPAMLRRVSPECILVHEAFYLHPGIFHLVLRRMRRALREARFIVDVRSPTVPRKRARLFREYDGVIACSENIASRLAEAGVPDERVKMVPVIQERIAVNEMEADQFVKELGVHAPYLLYVGRIKEEKRVDLLLDCFVDHIRRDAPELCLVLVGAVKTTKRSIIERMRSPGVILLGQLDRDSTLKLIARAAVCVNPSPIESLSRFSLEALALRRPVVLPPNVPEFEQHCRDFVAATPDPRELAALILEVFRAGVCPSYPIERHLPSNVMPYYESILTLT